MDCLCSCRKGTAPTTETEAAKNTNRNTPCENSNTTCDNSNSYTRIATAAKRTRLAAAATQLAGKTHSSNTAYHTL
jgi:hypothetical protein